MNGVELKEAGVKRVISLAIPVLLIAFGQMAVTFHWVPTAQFAAPSAVLPAAASLNIWKDLFWTCLRLAEGVLLDTFLGGFSGLLFSQN